MARKLSKEQFKTIRQWIYRNARPLDLARWRYHFEEASAEGVITALEAYQNDDGGFGHGLEADCLNPNSAPLQTWWAIQFMKEIGLNDSDHPMVQSVVRYLDSGDGMVNHRWLFSVATNNDYPHAQWWHYDETEEETGYNPTAALAGYLISHDPSKGHIAMKGEKLKREALDAFFSRKEIGMHELACYVELYEDLCHLKEQDQVMNQLKAALNDRVKDSIEYDTSLWATNYVCKPSHYFITPDSFLYAGNEKVIGVELDQMIDALSEEGTWPVTWQWNQWPEAFAISRNWWQANIIIQNLRLLRVYGRLEL